MIPAPTVFRQGQGAASADNLNTFIQTVVSVAQLRSFSGVDGMVISLQGAVSTADGKQGAYYWSSDATTADNGSTVIAPDSVAVGRWLLLPTSLFFPVLQASASYANDAAAAAGGVQIGYLYRNGSVVQIRVS